MRRTWTFGFGTLLTLLLSLAASAGELGTLRVGVLAFGTVNWELDVIRHHGLDAEQGFTLDVQEFGGAPPTSPCWAGRSTPLSTTGCGSHGSGPKVCR